MTIDAAAEPAGASASFPSQESMVRRTDVALRSLHPQLATRIFETEPHRYAIVFDAVQLDAGSIRENFSQRVCPASVAIDVSNVRPSTYLREIQPIDDRELAKGLEGFSFTFQDIGDILLSRFPDLPLPRGAPNQNNPILLRFEEELTPKQERQVRSVMTGILPGWPVAIDVSAAAEESEPRPSVQNGGEVEKLEVRPSRLRPTAPPFVRADEAFWFNNLEALFEGRLSPRSIPGADDAGVACYIDASAFPQIDLRQAVLLYDTIFFTPPLVDVPARPGFWEQQDVTRDGVLTLIESGRLRLVLRQPEERTDPSFLCAAYERDPDCILGRLTAAALLASDIVQTADEYTFARPELRRAVGLLSDALAEEHRLTPEIVSRLLLWPLHARRACLAPLLKRGLMGIAGFSQGSILAAELAGNGRDFELEALATSDGVHIAHALSATLIPPSAEMAGWIAPRRIVGDRLNFYRSFNNRIAAAWAGNERRKEQRIRVLPPLPLFEFERRAPMRDLITATSLGSTRRKGRALVARLASLPEEERNAELDRLSQELYEVGARQERRRLVLDVGNDAFEVAAAFGGLATLPLKGAWNLVARCASICRRIPALDALADAIDYDLREQFGSNSDLDFLSRVSRVAEVKDGFTLDATHSA